MRNFCANQQGAADVQEITLEQAIEGMWRPTEAERFVALAMSMPSFLNEQEEVLWQLIKSTAYFWEHFQVQIKDNQGKVIKEDQWPAISYKGLIREHLQQYWPLLNEIAAGKKPLSELAVLNVPPAKQTTVIGNKITPILVKQII